MNKFLKILTATLIVILMAGLCLLPAAQAEGPKTYELDVEYDYEAAEKLLGILNSYRESGSAWILSSSGERTELGALPALVMDETLMDAAMQRASELVVSFSHTRPDGSLCFTVNDAVAAENIGIFYASPEAMFQAFAEENQPYAGQGHRRNMLSSGLAYVGIGAVRYNGQWYWSMDFSRSAPVTDTVPERRTNGAPAFISVNPDTAGLNKGLSPETKFVSVDEGEETDLPVVFRTVGNARLEKAENVVWSSDDPDKAAVSGTRVRGVKAGMTVLRCTGDGNSTFISVQVRQASAAPAATPEPTAAPMATPEPTAAPMATPEPTAAPMATPEPTAAPTATPEPTAAPAATPGTDPATCTHPRMTRQVIRQPSCIYTGMESAFCPDCGYNRWNDIPSSPACHQLESTVIRKECGASYRAVHCKVEGCRYLEVKEKIADGNCPWGPVQVITPATAENEGTGVQTCPFCLAERTVSIPKPAGCSHVNTAVRITAEASCMAEGAEEEYCLDCGETLSGWAIPRKEHTGSPQLTTVREPTCTEQGLAERRCTCYEQCRGVVGTEPVNSLGHNYERGEDGVIRCTRCGDVPPQESGETHQHIWGPEQVLTIGDSGSDSRSRYDCMTCPAYMIVIKMPGTESDERGWLREIHEE